MRVLALIVLALDLLIQVFDGMSEENARLRAALWEEQRLRRVELEAHRSLRQVTRTTIEAMLDEAERQHRRQLRGS